jgi:hypothetical protein
MSLCALCGIDTNTVDSLCGYHTGGTDADWARSNRLMCDFIHRGVVLATPAVDVNVVADLLSQAA